MAAFANLVGCNQACEEGPRCRNSTELAGEVGSLCRMCQLAPGNGELQHHHWRPVDPGRTHPVLQRRKAQGNIDRLRAAETKRRAASPSKKQMALKAWAAEKQSEKVIRSTVNSGRSHQDGDHLAAGSIMLDTKLQSTRSNPVIRLDELAKISAQARRNGALIGGLILRNRMNEGFVVLKEQDFALILKRLTD